MYRSIVNRLKIIISDVTNVRENKISLSDNVLTDFKLNKRELEEIHVKIEEEFDIKLPKVIFQEFPTLSEIVGFIEVEIGR